MQKLNTNLTVFITRDDLEPKVLCVLISSLSLTHSVSQSSLSALQNDLGKCSGRATDGSQASFGLANPSRTWNKGTWAHADQMRHGMCVRRQLIWRRPELGTQTSADRCPCRREERQRSTRPLGAAENFRGQLDGWMPMGREGDKVHGVLGYLQLTTHLAQRSLAARDAGSPRPRPRQHGPAAFELGPGRISESLWALADRPPQPKLASCQATPHHTTTPHQYEERGRGGKRRIKMIQLKVSRSSPAPLPDPADRLVTADATIPGTRTILTPPPSPSP